MTLQQWFQVSTSIEKSHYGVNTLPESRHRISDAESVESCLINYLAREVLQGRGVYQARRVRHCGTREEVLSWLAHYGGFVPLIDWQYHNNKMAIDARCLLWSETAQIAVSIEEDAVSDWLMIDVVGITEAFDAFFAGLLTIVVDREDVQGKVKILCMSAGGNYLSDVGHFDEPFIPGNYTTDLVQAFGDICENILHEHPQGRLYILHGKAGTGKSHMIRGFVGAVQATFIYVPSSVVGELTSPRLFEALIEERRNDYPLVLILEDADKSLLRRQLDNVAEVSDILNMTDGLIGEALNIHIIATLNSTQTEIDPAILRQGRLAKYLEFVPLPRVKCCEILFRLVPDRTAEVTRVLAKGTHDLVLGDVYALAREKFGWTPTMSEGRPRSRRLRRRRPRSFDMQRPLF